MLIVLLFVAGRGQTCQICLVSRQAVHDSLAKPVLLARSPLQRVFRKASLTAEKLRSRGHLVFGLGELSAGCLRNIFGVLELRSPEAKLRKSRSTLLSRLRDLICYDIIL